MFIQRTVRAIVSPFKGLRIEEFMKIHGSMPDQIQIRSFLTVSGAFPVDSATTGAQHRRAALDQMRTPAINLRPTDAEESKTQTCSPAMSREIRDILDDLQNNQLQIYALWSEVGDVHRSII